MIHPRTAVLLAAALLAVLLGACAAPSPRPRPNIIFIMSDDHAAHAISAYGSRINSTPNLDRLAAQGMRFANAFCTNGICTPMRAVMLTGKYSHVNGVMDNDDKLPADAYTIADALGGAGYQTAMIGKWHLHRNPTGFDYWDILPGQGAYADPEFITNGKRTKNTGYVTDITTEKAINWINSRDVAKPFMLFCHYKAPHRNWVPDAAHADMFADRDIPLPPTFDDDYATRTAAATIQTMSVEHHLTETDVKGKVPEGLTGHDRKVWLYQRYIKDYLRCVASVDDNVGRLMKYLDEQGLAGDTIVVYTSDQGFYLGDHGWYDKRFMYEPSLRSPLIVRYPRDVKPGRVNDDMALTIDFAPTFLDYAGISAQAAAHGMQGESLRPLLEGRQSAAWRSSMYYHYYESGEPHTVPKHYGVRTERYKLIRFYELPGAQWELFDLGTDPDELKNLYTEDPASALAPLIADLKAELVRLRTRYNDTTGAPLASAERKP